MNKYVNVKIVASVIIGLVAFHFLSGMLFKQRVTENGELTSEFRGARAA